MSTVDLPVLDKNGNVIGREIMTVDELAKDLKEKTLDMFECPRSSLPEEFRHNWKREKVSLLSLHKCIEKRDEKAAKRAEKERETNERNARIEKYAEQFEATGRIEYQQVDINIMAFLNILAR